MTPSKEDTERILREMDAAAAAAALQLEELAKDPTLQPGIAVVAKWMQQHYAKAGYKRLSRALITRAR